MLYYSVSTVNVCAKNTIWKLPLNNIVGVRITKMQELTNHNSLQVEHQEQIRQKCIEQTTMRIKASKRKRNRGDGREAKEPVIDKRVCVCIMYVEIQGQFI